MLCALSLIVLLASVWSGTEAADSSDYGYESYYDYSEGQGGGEQSAGGVHESTGYYEDYG